MVELSVSVLTGISGISAAEWDGCLQGVGDGGNPFVTHRFLAALEESGSVGERNGWYPQHLVARLGGQIELCCSSSGGLRVMLVFARPEQQL